MSRLTGNTNLLERTKLLLRNNRIFPNKLLGQNFMIESSILQKITDYASLNLNDVVLDVGAGLGFLTRRLADKCKHVLAVESDARLVDILHKQLEDLTNIKIIRGNVLRVQIPHFNKIVSIPPYNISSHILLWLFQRKFDCAVLIFQKEFANRLVASLGSEDYGWLTVFTYYHEEVELLENVSKWMFYPQPKVDSIIIRLRPKKPPPFRLKNEMAFKQMVRSLFTQRNKKARNALASFIKCTHFANVKCKKIDAIPFSDRRIRELAPEDFGELANALFD